ncbi:MAG: response regulator transcription factor [Verrucomicrobiales bacterium]|nr:response regulator transcription factor [Verrucomicrobiales bacterium]
MRRLAAAAWDRALGKLPAPHSLPAHWLPSSKRHNFTLSSAAIDRPVKKKIFVVEDHAAVRQGIVETINRENDLVVCGEADDVSFALSVISTASADLVLIDIELKSSSGLELIRELRLLFPALPLIAMTMFDPVRYENQARAAGANNFVVKQEGAEKMLAAIRQALPGDLQETDRE